MKRYVLIIVAVFILFFNTGCVDKSIRIDENNSLTSCEENTESINICEDNCVHEIGFKKDKESVKYITRELNDEDIWIFCKQGEILSDHISKYLISGLFLEESKIIYPDDIQNGAVWDFILNSHRYNNFEIHPYNDYCSYGNWHFSVSEENAKVIAYELFGIEDWSYKKDDDFYWCSNTNKVILPNGTGGISTNFELMDIKAEYMEKDKIVIISFDVYATNAEIDMLNEKVSNTTIRYSILTEQYGTQTGKTFMRLLNIEHVKY